jgi:pyruvyltransferase
MNSIPIFWWKRRFGWLRGMRENCGDAMCPVIVRALSGRRPFLKRRGGGRFVTIGSVLHYVQKGDVIWGTGAIDERAYTGPKDIQIKAVRGPRTALLLGRTGLKVPDVYGDPGALIPRMLALSPTGEFEVGIVPHFQDYKAALALFRGTEARVIDITSGVKEVCHEIARCRRIFSSSLHGLVIGECLGIDSWYVRISGASAEVLRAQGRDDFKFQDYYEGSGRSGVTALDWTRGVPLEDLLASKPVPQMKYDAESLLKACPFNERGIYSVEDLQASYKEDPFLDGDSWL